MNIEGLTISISAFKGTPLVTVIGNVDACRAQSLEDVMESFLIDGAAGVTLDVTQASFTDIEGSSALVRMLRVISRDVQVAVAASSKIATTLRFAGLEPYMTICSGLDQVYQQSGEREEFLTSRWMASTANDEELPLAA
jgi:anti-anti-sigma factor